MAAQATPVLEVIYIYSNFVKKNAYGDTDQRSPRPPEVGVLRHHRRHVTSQTDMARDLLTDMAQRAESVKSVYIGPTNC